MSAIIRRVSAILAGLLLALALVVAVELFSAVVHPTPPGFTGTQEEMCAHVARYPHWVLAVVVVAWSATGFAAAWLATRLGSISAGAIVSAFLFVALAANLAMLPYPTWFKLAMPVCFAAACFWAVRVNRRGNRTLAGLT